MRRRTRPGRVAAVLSGFVTVTVRVPSAASTAMLIVATSWSLEGTDTSVTVIPAPKLAVAPLWKFAPAMVTSRVSP